MPSEPTVFVVDDDRAIRDSLRRLLESVGLPVETFGSARDFLDEYDALRPGCVLLDVRMPGMSGLELQDKLFAEDLQIPVIIITGHGDVPMAVRALRAGAADFIEKPFRAQILLDSVQRAIERDAKNRQRQRRRADVAARLELLTPRERQVAELLASGKSVKDIARHFGLSHKAVQVHRAHIMEKTQAGSIAHFVRLMLAVEEHSEEPVRR